MKSIFDKLFGSTNVVHGGAGGAYPGAGGKGGKAYGPGSQDGEDGEDGTLGTIYFPQEPGIYTLTIDQTGFYNIVRVGGAKGGAA